MKRTVFYIIILSLSLHATRTPHRGIKPNLPRITVYNSDDPIHTYTLTDNNLRPTPLLYIFDYKYFMQHMLPPDIITSTQEDNKFKTQELNAQINTLLEEINLKKRLYTNFTILAPNSVLV